MKPMCRTNLTTKLLRALLALGAASLFGCASYHPPMAMPEAKIPSSKLSDARNLLETLKVLNRDIEAVAAASADVCLHRGPRVAFISLVNPPLKDEELRAAFLVAGLRAQPQFISTGPSTQALDGKYITKVGTEVIRPGEAGKAYSTAIMLAHEKHGGPTVSLEFTDKTKVALMPLMGCSGLVLADLGENEPLDFGVGWELLSLAWFSSAHSRDERLFLAGRSLYFASDAGAVTLNKGLLGGAALNGVLTGLTMGLSRLFVDTKLTVTHMMREGVLKEADEFGLRAAVRAGANPKLVMAYVERMTIEKVKSTKFKELWFEDGRVMALAAVADALTGEHSPAKLAQAIGLREVPVSR